MLNFKRDKPCYNHQNFIKENLVSLRNRLRIYTHKRIHYISKRCTIENKKKICQKDKREKYNIILI